MRRLDTDSTPFFDIKKLAAWAFCIICAVICIYFIFKHALSIFLPFIIAFFFALLTNRPASYLSKKTGISKKFFSVVILIIIVVGAVFLLFLGINRLIFESERFLSKINDEGNRLGANIASAFERLSSLINTKNPFFENLMKAEAFREFREDLDASLSSVISDAAADIAKGIYKLALSIIKALPELIIFITVTLISSFYFCLDYDRLKRAAGSLLPNKLSEKAHIFQKQVCFTAVKYVRAYLLLLLLTFFQLLTGFLLLRTPYPLLLAIAVALIDFLPILGVGAVLIPWGISELILSQNYYQGIGLLILYIIVVIVRQITEPKIISESLGLHPLVTLSSMYAGLKIFGISGMLLGPMIALAAKAAFSSYSKKRMIDKA